MLTLLTVVVAECIHNEVPSSRKTFSRIGVSFITVGAAVLIVDYASQLTFIQPALLLAETEGLSPWSQYNPHGIFIALETVGYVSLNLGFLFLGVAMLRAEWSLWRASGWIFIASGALTLALLVVYSAVYRVRLDYRFEVISILVTWLVLIVVPVMLSMALIRARATEDQRAVATGVRSLGT